MPTLLPTPSNQTSKIRTNSNSSGIESNSARRSSNSKNKTNSKIKAGSKIKTGSDSEQRNSKSKTDSNSAPNRINAGSKIKTGNDSEPRNRKINTDSNSGRNSSANRMSTSVRVQISNGKLNRGTFGSSVGHTPGIPSTAPGSNVAAIAVTAYLTIGSAAPLARIITSESTANP